MFASTDQHADASAIGHLGRVSRIGQSRHLFTLPVELELEIRIRLFLVEAKKIRAAAFALHEVGGLTPSSPQIATSVALSIEPAWRSR